MEEAPALEEKEGKRQAGLGSRSLGEEDSLPRLIKSSYFSLNLFFQQVALRGSVIQGGGGGEVESRSSVIQSSQVHLGALTNRQIVDCFKVVRPTHIVPRPAAHQQVVMGSSQASTFVNQQQGNDFTSSHHSLGQAERLGREGLRPSLAGSRQLVELLQPSRGGRASQRPMKNVNLRQKAGRDQLKQETGLSRVSQHPVVRSTTTSSLPLVPPPPPGSLPQPTFTIGSSSAIVPEDSKLSRCFNFTFLLEISFPFSAEQKRRGTIKNGFEFLRALVPSLSQTPNVKISKAALLTKVLEFDFHPFHPFNNTIDHLVYFCAIYVCFKSEHDRALNMCCS